MMNGYVQFTEGHTKLKMSNLEGGTLIDKPLPLMSLRKNRTKSLKLLVISIFQQSYLPYTPYFSPRL
jgi:hypothetical protein